MAQGISRTELDGLRLSYSKQLPLLIEAIRSDKTETAKSVHYQTLVNMAKAADYSFVLIDEITQMEQDIEVYQ